MRAKKHPPRWKVNPGIVHREGLKGWGIYVPAQAHAWNTVDITQNIHRNSNILRISSS